MSYLYLNSKIYVKYVMTNFQMILQLFDKLYILMTTLNASFIMHVLIHIYHFS